MRDDRLLFEPLSFSLRDGEALLIEGANGSGKTTLLRALCGLFLAEEGRIEWSGTSIQRDRPAYQADLIYLGHTAGVKVDLTATENIDFWRHQRGAPAQCASKQALEAVGMRAYRDTAVRYLSAGQRRRVGLARLLAVRSRLWILDEPFTALDRGGVQMVQSMVEDHCARGGIAILSSHQNVTLQCPMAAPVMLS